MAPGYLREKPCRCNNGHGNGEAEKHHQAYIGPQLPCGGKRAGRWRNEHMAGVQPHAQRHRKGGKGCTGLFGQRTIQRRQYDKPRIAEDGNRYKKAGDAHGEQRARLADPAQHRAGHERRPTGFFKQGANDRTRGDNDPDIADRAAETLRDGRNYGGSRQSRRKPDQIGRNQQHKKRMRAKTSRRHDDENDGPDKNCYEDRSAQPASSCSSTSLRKRRNSTRRRICSLPAPDSSAASIFCAPLIVNPLSFSKY